MPFGVTRERRPHFDRVPAIPTSSEIERAAAILRAGGLVAFPETVYGLAPMRQSAAVAKLPPPRASADHPLIVHLAAIELLPREREKFPPPRRSWLPRSG